jgi:hypothetical protein
MAEGPRPAVGRWRGWAHRLMVALRARPRPSADEVVRERSREPVALRARCALRRLQLNGFMTIV